MSTGLDASKRHVSDNLLQHFRLWRFLFVFFLFSSFYAGFVCPSWVFFFFIVPFTLCIFIENANLRPATKGKEKE